MLPAKIGEGVVGSNSGGVNPIGAFSLVSASAPSAAAARTVLENLTVLELLNDTDEDAFHGIATRSPDFRVVVKMEVCVAMAMDGDYFWSDSEWFVYVDVTSSDKGEDREA